MAERLALLLHILEVLGLILCLQIGYPQSLQVNVRPYYLQQETISPFNVYSQLHYSYNIKIRLNVFQNLSSSCLLSKNGKI